MAPPPNPNLPLKERLIALAQTLQCACPFLSSSAFKSSSANSCFSASQSLGSLASLRLPLHPGHLTAQSDGTSAQWMRTVTNLCPDSHLTLILTTIRYGFSWLRMNYYGGMAQFSYRTSFVAAALTYGIVVYKTQRARAKSGTRAPGGYIGLLADENVQYLGTTLSCASKLCPGRR
ncbi:ER membrane protein [Ilyonectria robusta]